MREQARRDQLVHMGTTFFSFSTRSKWRSRRINQAGSSSNNSSSSNLFNIRWAVRQRRQRAPSRPRHATWYRCLNSSQSTTALPNTRQMITSCYTTTILTVIPSKTSRTHINITRYLINYALNQRINLFSSLPCTPALHQTFLKTVQKKRRPYTLCTHTHTTTRIHAQKCFYFFSLTKILRKIRLRKRLCTYETFVTVLDPENQIRPHFECFFSFLMLKPSWYLEPLLTSSKKTSNYVHRISFFPPSNKCKVLTE